jgi:hypothetical protein
VLANARDVLARLERYELEVFAEEDAGAAVMPEVSADVAMGAGAGSATDNGSASSSSDALSVVASRAGRRKVAAQVSLFDLVNQKIIDEIRDLNVDGLSSEEAKELLRAFRERLL